MNSIPLKEIYQHRINFLIGSGASFGLFPTLALEMSDSNGGKETIETLATKLNEGGNKNHLTLLFMHYYKEIIEPAFSFDFEEVESHTKGCAKTGDDKMKCIGCIKAKVLENYRTFIDTTVRLLQHKKRFSRRCNLFTTNYDGCIPFAADSLTRKGQFEFLINDGTNGFLERILSAKNFNTYQCRSGVFERHADDIPQINLINLHGSVFWSKNDENIVVNYKQSEKIIELPVEATPALTDLASILKDNSKTIDDIINITVNFQNGSDEAFWAEYNKLPIVNPTKWKFYETVFEEHYYQMLRLLSYQLEERNSVLITFAFSFADEHILNLIKRSLSNPKLQVFICCFNAAEKDQMAEKFKGFRNVQLIESEDGYLDFTKFNDTVFSSPQLASGEQ